MPSTTTDTKINSALVDIVKDNPCITSDLLSIKLRTIFSPQRIYFCSSGSFFYARINRLIDKGLIINLFVRNRNHYYAYVPLPTDKFDLKDKTDRLVAADWCEENNIGSEQFRQNLRDCTKVRIKS